MKSTEMKSPPYHPISAMPPLGLTLPPMELRDLISYLSDHNQKNLKLAKKKLKHGKEEGEELMRKNRRSENSSCAEGAIVTEFAPPSFETISKSNWGPETRSAKQPQRLADPFGGEVRRPFAASFHREEYLGSNPIHYGSCG